MVVAMKATGRTLSQKVWDDHVVSVKGNRALLYIDLHLVHEVTSPQAFEGLRITRRKVRRPDLTVATEDHNVPTVDQTGPIEDPIGRKQIETLRSNVAEWGIKHFPMGSKNQGIVHVIGPEQGLTLPGMTIVCGDSHTSTHGAFGALAFGIGTSEVEHVLATQTLPQLTQETMAVTINGELPAESTAKDVVLTLLGRVGTGGGVGAIAEYRGNVIENLSMEGRMTICNMSIEWGAKAGMVAPDQTTFDYIKGRPYAPKGKDWDEALEHWAGLVTDDDAVFDREVVIDAADCVPHVSWGTNPGQVVPLKGHVPDPADFDDPDQVAAAERALTYMDLAPGTSIQEIPIDAIFIGSCTNSRIEDLRAAAQVLRGRKALPHLRKMVVPGSRQVRAQAEAEGLDQIFIDAGFQWREPGCSMCLGMNADQLDVGERSASTSNRNFEGRQGRGARTHLVSPQVAAATSILGHLGLPSDL